MFSITECAKNFLHGQLIDRNGRDRDKARVAGRQERVCNSADDRISIGKLNHRLS